MGDNKIGSDILGQGGLPQGGLSEKKRQELLQKMKEAKHRKAMRQNRA